MLPLPASPLVRIIAAPSPIRRSASPRLRAPHTNGERKSCFATWCSSSAGVSTSLSSMKSTPSDSSTRASRKCPIRTFAITGIETVRWMPSITSMLHMRATPPSLRMSAGTRSSAITAAAPASSAIFACSGFVTSMITPPLSISASPILISNDCAPLRASPFPLDWVIAISSSSRNRVQTGTRADAGSPFVRCAATTRASRSTPRRSASSPAIANASRRPFDGRPSE